MAPLFSFLPLPPLPEFTQATNPFCTPIPEDVLRLQTDTVNVMEGRVSLYSFSIDYQKKIRDYYRFVGHRQNSKSHNIVPRTRNTLDII